MLAQDIKSTSCALLFSPGRNAPLTQEVPLPLLTLSLEKSKWCYGGVGQANYMMDKQEGTANDKRQMLVHCMSLEFNLVPKEFS